MALTITKNQTLQGVIHLNESVPAVYQYFFELPTQNYPNALPNALDNQVLEEVYIIVDHNEPTQIYLPSISSLKNAWGLKIYVINMLGGSVEVFPYSSETGVDTITGLTSVTIINKKGCAFLHAVESNMWMCLNQPGAV